MHTEGVLMSRFSIEADYVQQMVEQGSAEEKTETMLCSSICCT